MQRNNFRDGGAVLTQCQSIAKNTDTPEPATTTQSVLRTESTGAAVSTTPTTTKAINEKEATLTNIFKEPIRCLNDP